MLVAPAGYTEAEWLLEQRSWRTDPHGILRWATTLGLRNEKGELLEWEDHRFLIEPLCDMHPLQVYRKCSQVGMTTIEILKTIFLAQVMGYGIIYTLPTKELVGDFSSTKAEPLLNQNPVLRPTGADAVSKRVYGGGFVLYRGTFGERETIMVTADLLAQDEADRSNLAVLEGLESRLTHSKYKGKWIWSNPTRPNIGTDVLWQISDQRHWHVVCPHCGEDQHLDPWDNLDRERRLVVCRACQGELGPEDRRNGRWVPHQPGARWHGRQMNQLMAPWITAEELVEAEKTKSQEYVHNFLWGLPVVGGGLGVDRDTILRARVWPVPEGQQPRQKFVGVDVGGGLHVVIGNEHGITKMAYLTDEKQPQDRWDALERLLTMEQPTLTVIDNAPAEGQVNLQRKLGKHRLLRCIYDYNDKRQETWEKNSDEGTVNAHRTRVIDDTIADIAEGRLPVYMEQHDPWLNGTGKAGVENCLAHHWGTLYVSGADGQSVNVVKRDRMGNVIRTWENAGPDHFAHATVYYRLARQIGRHLGGDHTGFLPGGMPGERQRKRNVDDWDDDDERSSGPTFYGQ